MRDSVYRAPQPEVHALERFLTAERPRLNAQGLSSPPKISHRRLALRRFLVAPKFDCQLVDSAAAFHPAHNHSNELAANVRHDRTLTAQRPRLHPYGARSGILVFVFRQRTAHPKLGLTLCP